jgi:hypothetical protein
MAAPVFALSAQAKPAAPAAAPAAAAPVADACPIDLLQPTGLAVANLQRPKLANVKSADDANKVMKDVSKLLFDPKQATNPMGRDMLLAQFVTFYAQFADSAKRGDVGFPGDKMQYVDMLKMADSLFTIIETAEPKCKMQTLGWRNYKPYTDRVKAGYAAVGAGAADTASDRSRTTSSGARLKFARTKQRKSRIFSARQTRSQATRSTPSFARTSSSRSGARIRNSARARRTRRRRTSCTGTRSFRTPSS